MGFQDSFKALSDPTRREILTLLRAGPLTVGELLEHFSITGASLSHHLSILRHAGLIDDEKKGEIYLLYTKYHGFGRYPELDDVPERKEL